MDEIKAWLSSARNIEDGLRLYLQHGKNEFLKTRFAATRDAYTRQKLAEELQKLSGKVGQAQKLVKESQKPPQYGPPEDPAKSNIQPVIQEADQARYLDLLRKRDDIIKQIERNMGMLDFSTDQTILFETAKQILKLHQKKCEIWAQIDFFQANGCFEIINDNGAPLAKEKEFQLLYQAISKAKKRLQNGKCKNVTKTQRLLDKHQARLQHLKKHATD